MSEGERVFEAARVGHRITHEDDLPPPKEVLPQVLEHVAKKLAEGKSGAEMSVHYGTLQTFRVEGEDAGECPDPTGEIEEGSPDTFVGPEAMAAAVVDEDMVVPCENCDDGPLITGAAHVFVNNTPWVRRMDQVDCGAYVGEGEPTVLLGGEPSAEPGDGMGIELHPEFGALLGSGKLDGGAGISAELGKVLASGGVEFELQPSRPSGSEIARHIAENDNAKIINLLTQ